MYFFTMVSLFLLECGRTLPKAKVQHFKATFYPSYAYLIVRSVLTKNKKFRMMRKTLQHLMPHGRDMVKSSGCGAYTWLYCGGGLFRFFPMRSVTLPFDWRLKQLFKKRIPIYDLWCIKWLISNIQCRWNTCS